MSGSTIYADVTEELLREKIPFKKGNNQDVKKSSR